MSKTDEYFNSLAVRLQHDPAGLLALSQIMESHMRYSIDPRLSSDPLTALAAVMREHECEFNHDNGVFEVYDRDSNLLLTHNHGTVGYLDIKSEQSND